MFGMKIQKEEVALIIPTYNEKENIEKTIGLIQKTVPNILIYVVDDNSPDKTQEIVRKLSSKKNSNVSLIVRTKKSGRGGAVLEGMKIAMKNGKTQYFMEMDADLSHSPLQIPSILEKRHPKTICIGSRYIKGSKIVNWPKKRIILSGFANRYISFILRVKINDFTNGFRCYPRAAVKQILRNDIQHKGFITLSETVYLLSRKGFEFVEIPITFKDRTRGKSNATMHEVFMSLLAVIQIRFGKLK